MMTSEVINMFTFVAAAVVAVMTAIVVKSALEQRKELAAFKAKHEKCLKVVDTSKQFVALHVVVVIFSLAMTLVIFINPTLEDPASRISYIVLCTGLALFYFLNLVLSKDCEKLYLTKESVYIDGEEIRYSSIKEVNIKRTGTHLITYTGKKLRITKAKALAINEALTTYKQEKAEKKKKH